MAVFTAMPALLMPIGICPRGSDFETRLIAKNGLVEQSSEEFCKPGYVCRPINLSGDTYLLPASH